MFSITFGTPLEFYCMMILGKETTGAGRVIYAPPRAPPASSEI